VVIASSGLVRMIGAVMATLQPDESNIAPIGGSFSIGTDSFLQGFRLTTYAVIVSVSTLAILNLSQRAKISGVVPGQKKHDSAN
jgi:hypothetical protein